MAIKRKGYGLQHRTKVYRTWILKKVFNVNNRQHNLGYIIYLNGDRSKCPHTGKIKLSFWIYHEYHHHKSIIKMYIVLFFYYFFLFRLVKLIDHTCNLCYRMGYLPGSKSIFCCFSTIRSHWSHARMDWQNFRHKQGIRTFLKLCYFNLPVHSLNMAL